MQLGIFARTFTATGARPVLDAARTAGYDCVQWNMACLGLPSLPHTVDAHAAEAIAAASHETGVALAALSGTCNMVHPDPDVRVDGRARLDVLVRAAPLMGTRLVTLCTGTRDPIDMWRHHPDNSSSEAWRDLLDAMAGVLTAAEAYDVDLGVEPEPGNVVSTPERARDLIDTLRSPRLRIVLDPANLVDVASADQRRTAVERAIDLLADRIALAHAKDRRADGSVAPAGSGIIDFGHFVGRLHRAGFDGPLVTHGLTPAAAPGVAAFLRRAIESAARQ